MSNRNPVFPHARLDAKHGQSCVIPCNQILQFGTAFPCLLDGLEGYSPQAGTLLPCPTPDKDQPQAWIKAIIASNLMREDLALYLCIQPDNAEIRSLYYLLEQKLHCLHETAEGYGYGQACVANIPLYPLDDVEKDAELGERIHQFSKQVYGPTHLASLHTALYTHLDHPVSNVFGCMATQNIRIGKLLRTCANSLGAASTEYSHPMATSPLPVDVLLQSVIDGCAAAVSKAQALAQRTQDKAVIGVLHFTQVRMQVHAVRARQAQSLLALAQPPHPAQ